MQHHFIPHRWLSGYPVGTMCHSYTTPTDATATAESLHKVLGERRESFRPDDSADSLTRIECLLKSLFRSS